MSLIKCMHAPQGRQHPFFQAQFQSRELEGILVPEQFPVLLESLRRQNSEVPYHYLPIFTIRTAQRSDATSLSPLELGTSWFRETDVSIVIDIGHFSFRTPSFDGVFNDN